MTPQSTMRERCGAETRRPLARQKYIASMSLNQAIRKKEKCPGGSAQPVEKAHFGQGNQRQSKPFPLIFLAPAWPGFAGF
jgi:hypothetical protein